MLVKFKRDFFGDGGVLYKKGTREYNGPTETEDGRSLLPSDALIVSEKGTLPVMTNSPKPGHGAKPLEEQVLDLIPGAGVTHQVTDTGPDQTFALTEDERKAREADDAKLREKERETDTNRDKETAAEQAKAAEKGVAQAAEAAKLVEKATDPLSSILGDGKAKDGGKK